MALRVEHEIHRRRRGRNVGLLVVLIGFVGIVFGLTVVKTLNLGSAAEMERFDHVARPALDVAAEREAADTTDAAAPTDQGEEETQR
ncbi:hypothetical protein [Wenxinia saemankumensis]|uniref:Cytochrome C oxidase assembly protein n=1 Tax=Wenxinia saemankumensis TaxID=1447782 RepID=A0A1M6GVV8_9RHOB|nr:hypothetical protein [Wenxinia saemankumensis]SHJ14034.1 hypothetical protein SAMN05444417_2955 [Wenxinia saemankumensis]